jgi:hypothetical protein
MPIATTVEQNLPGRLAACNIFMQSPRGNGVGTRRQGSNGERQYGQRKSRVRPHFPLQRRPPWKDQLGDEDTSGSRTVTGFESGAWGRNFRFQAWEHAHVA